MAEGFAILFTPLPQEPCSDAQRDQCVARLRNELDRRLEENDDSCFSEICFVTLIVLGGKRLTI